MRLKNFELDEQYLTDVTIIESGSIYGDRTDLTDAELLKVIKGEATWTSTSSKDHPNFTVLREQLEREGYLYVERGWWNGDRVLKPFKFNGLIFRKGGKFPSAAAMGIHLTVRRNHPNLNFDF
jgi:hypothetical protein